MTNQINARSVSMTEAVNYLTNIASPNTGSPEGILKVIQLMNNIKNSLNTVYNSNKSYIKGRDTSDETTSKNTNLGSTSRAKSYVTEKVFKNKFDSSIPKTIGFDYLFEKRTSVATSDNGIASISKDMMEKRCNLEIEKYFTSTKPNLLIKNNRGDILNKGDSIGNTKYSFLSPSNIFLETQNKDLVFQSLKSVFTAPNRKEMNSLASDIITYNKSKSLFYSKSTDSSDRDQITASSIEQMLSDSGVVVRTPAELMDERAVKTTSFSENAQARNIDNGDNLFEGRTEERQTLSSDLLQSLLQVSETDFLEESNSIYSYLFSDDDSAEKIKRKLTDALMRTTRQQNSRTGNNPLNYSPNHLKALMLSLQNSNQVKSNKAFAPALNQPQDMPIDVFKNPENYGFLWFNYKSIKMIEVLSGFNSKGSAQLINSPVWVQLDESHFKSTRNKVLICRVVPYEDAVTGLKRNENLELPVFNEIFAINLNGSNNKATSNNSIPFVSFSDKEIQSRFSQNKFFTASKQIKEYYDKRMKFVEPARSSMQGMIRSELVFSDMFVYNGAIPDSSKITIARIENARQQLALNKGLNLNQLRDKVKQNGLEKYVSTSAKDIARSGTSTRTGATGTQGSGGSTY
tara:strand:- start:243 stop:2132 length:1890 start_codon:yes stop_codon:yes gene_type:complete